MLSIKRITTAKDLLYNAYQKQQQESESYHRTQSC